MRRFKNCCDKLRPELNFSSQKNLRDQGLRIEKNKVVMETEYETITTSTSKNISINVDYWSENNNIDSTRNLK